MTSITKQQSKTDFSNQLWRTYDWFYTEFSQRVKDSCAEFFGLDLDFKLFSLSENDNVLFKGDLYFVTQIKVTKNLIATVKLSQTAVKAILNETLGANNQTFSLEKLSELEAKIITSFNDFLFSNIKKILIQAEKIDKKEQAKSLCHAVFYMSKSGKDFGKLVITIPTNLLAPEVLECDESTFSISDFKTCETFLKIKVGSSKIKLGEVKELQVDDIILLENSNIYKMTICNGGEEVEFKLSPDPRIILNTDDEGDDMGENAIPASNLWDNIQVDINAEFEKVKISLGELKQISEGLVVDIGSIYDNRIDLKVENKLVAKGELVIINDRYGVRIDEVVQTQTETEPDELEQVVTPQSEIHDENLGEEDFTDEDFNYDDFDEDNI